VHLGCSQRVGCNQGSSVGQGCRVMVLVKALPGSRVIALCFLSEAPQAPPTYTHTRTCTNMAVQDQQRMPGCATAGSSITARARHACYGGCVAAVQVSDGARDGGREAW